jgi:hypothetical protein
MLIHGISRNYPHVGRSYGGPVHAINLFKPSTFNNFYFGEASVAGQTEKAGMPVSGSNPYLFVYPPKSGGLSSRNNTDITFSDVANAVMGLPATGSATLTFTADGTGGLDCIRLRFGDAHVLVSQQRYSLSRQRVVQLPYPLLQQRISER